MLRVFAAIISLLFIQQVYAQQVYFIYLQAENRKPFYARMNNKVYSSNSSGYLLLPKLQNGGYRLAIGFPGQNKTEEEFLFTVNGADQGFDLKEHNNGAHYLFNLLNYKMEYPVTADAGTGKDTASAGNFGDLLAEAVKDPSVKQIEPVKKEPSVKTDKPVEPPVAKKKEELSAPEDTLKQVVAPVQKTETPPVQNNPVQEVKKEEPATPGKVIEEPVKTNLPAKEPAETIPQKVTGEVVVVFRKPGKDGADLVFADHTNGQRDTVRIFLPRLADDTLTAVPPKPVPEAIPEKAPEPVKEMPKTEPVKEVAPPKKDSPFLDIEVKNPNKETTPVAPDTLKQEVKPVPVAPDSGTASGKLVMRNTDCKKIAGDEDFVKLRKKMAGETSDEAMIAAAIKTFKTRCFTTEQV
ncbi:MAG: hypothetical protein JNM68_08510, partial [Dinghuibacter sp.]|nr:hypothetical protein [Dinghuibacter sp.]